MVSKYTSLTEEQVQEMLAKESIRRNSSRSIINPDIELDPVVEELAVKLEPIIEEPTVELELVIAEPDPVVEEPVIEIEELDVESDPVVEEPIIEPEPVVEELPVNETIVDHTGKKYKIAIFFRGALRGDINTTIEYIKNSLDELSAKHIVHSYLLTWGTTFDDNVKTLLNAIKFDNVILQTAPSDEQIRRFVKRADFGCYPVSNVYRMYYQTKTALDIIINAYDYDYIIHSRTDVKITFGEHLNDWFITDHYNTPPSGAPWLCDWVGVAVPTIMYNAWNYGTLEQLGNLIDEKHVPEHILLDIMNKNDVRYRTAHLSSIFLNPNRMEPGDRL